MIFFSNFSFIFLPHSRWPTTNKSMIMQLQPLLPLTITQSPPLCVVHKNNISTYLISSILHHHYLCFYHPSMVSHHHLPPCSNPNYFFRTAYISYITTSKMFEKQKLQEVNSNNLVLKPTKTINFQFRTPFGEPKENLRNYEIHTLDNYIM